MDIDIPTKNLNNAVLSYSSTSYYIFFSHLYRISVGVAWEWMNFQ
jgi:hypothetical protein